MFMAGIASQLNSFGRGVKCFAFSPRPNDQTTGFAAMSISPLCGSFPESDSPATIGQSVDR